MDRPDDRGELLSARASFAQERLWAQQEREPGARYHEVCAVQIRGKLEVELLQRSLSHLEARHEALRTTFRAIDGQVHQVVWEPRGLSFEFHDLRHLGKAAEAEARRLIVEMSRRPLDLGRGPLYQLALIRLDEREHWLGVSAHRAVTDSWSFGLLTADLAAIYSALSLGQEPRLAPIEVQHADYAAWQREQVDGPELAPSLMYWRERLSPAPPPLQLAPVQPRRRAHAGSVRRVSFSLDAELSASLSRIASERRTNLSMVLLAAYEALIYRFAEQTDLAIATEVSGRHDQVQSVIGCFGNTLVLRSTIPEETPFEQWLTKVAGTIAEAHAHQDVPFEKLASELAPSGPLAQAAFRVRQWPDPLSAPGSETTFRLRDDFEPTAAAVALGLTVYEAGQLSGFFEYDQELLKAETAERMERAFRELLRRIVEAPGTPVRELVYGGAAALPKLERASRAGELPPSAHQERLWLLQQWKGEQPVVTNILSARLAAPVDVPALKRALSELSRRHEILRTTYHTHGNQPFLQVSPVGPIELVEADLLGVPEQERAPRARDIVSTFAARPFDLGAELLRAVLLHVHPEEQWLVVCIHRIAADGTSAVILKEELLASYEAFRAGKTPALPDPGFQYLDYSAWERRCLQGGAFDRQLAFWKEKLRPASPVLNLPTDFPRPRVLGMKGAFHMLHLSAECAHGIRELCREEEATTFMVLYAVLATLLQRYTQQESFVLGVAVSGRNSPESMRMVGPLANVVLLPADMSGRPTFRELLRRVRAMALEAYDHQDVPLGEVLDTVHPQRDFSRSRLFQVQLNLMSFDREVFEHASEALLDERVIWGDLVGNLDLSVVAFDHGDGFHVMFGYNAELFRAERIARMKEHFGRMLEAALRAPDTRTSHLPMLSAEEQRLMLQEWNPRAEYPQERCLHERFEEQARRTPERIALVSGDSRLTYAELDRRANQLAHRLARMGVTPDSRVGLLCDRSAELVVAILGTLKAGAGYVPMDPHSPPQRIALMLEDSAPTVVVTESAWVEKLPAQLGAQVLVLDRERAALNAEPTTRPASRTTPESLAYVIYTSGSTGRPKGVLIPHENVLRLMEATRELYGFGPEDVWPLFHSYAFDVSVWELWGALLHGGRLVIVPYLVSRSPEAFYQLLCDEGVTVLNQTPAAFYPLARVEESPGRRELIRSLRYVIFAGEALDYQALRPWFARHGDEKPRLVNMYGITETTVHSTFRAITAEDAVPHGSGSPVGQPLPHLQVHILDGDLQPVPVGVAGEIYVGGGALARGYLGRPDVTAQRFVPDPFSTTPGARLYRSGDSARRLESGELEYLGRLDFQVKLRGFRIELEEIETALAAHPAVRQVCVLLREDSPGDKRLVAYLVATPPAPSVSELRGVVERKLPDYMVPSAFVLLDAFPLTSNGKVDRRALPAPDSERPEIQTPHEPPRTDFEAALAGLWSELLRIERIGVHDNFFELGGHSLLLMRLTARIEETFGVRLPIATLLDVPTVDLQTRAIAARLLELEAPETADELVREVAQLSTEDVKPALER